MNETPPASTQANAAPQKDGITLIATERQRQLNVENWTPAHDDTHVNGEMADAAAFYAMARFPSEDIWPWDREWYKPGSRIRDLTKAGALISAEIDRLLRLEERGGHSVSDRSSEHATSVSSENPAPPSSTELEEIAREAWAEVIRDVLCWNEQVGDNSVDRAGVAKILAALTKASSLKPKTLEDTEKNLG